MTPEATITVAAAVVALTQLAKWAGTPDRFGPIVVLGLSAIGVAIWKADNPADITWFSLFAGLISVATSAAGVFGFTRASAEAITKTSITTAGRGFVVIFMVGGLATTGAACTARQGHAIATADDIAHDGLARFDDLLDARCDAERLPAPACKSINAVLVPTWDAYIIANRAARGGDVSKIPEFTRAVERLIDEVKRLVTEGQQLLLDELALAKTQVGK